MTINSALTSFLFLFRSQGRPRRSRRAKSFKSFHSFRGGEYVNSVQGDVYAWTSLANR
jgi:hypothetical protein